MNNVCYEQLEQLKEDMSNDQFGSYVDTWDLEDEYSHNEINEAREQFLVEANQYFTKYNMPYEAREVVENVYIFNKITGERM